MVDRNLNIIGQSLENNCKKDIEMKQIKSKNYNFEMAKDSVSTTNGNVGRFIRRVYGEHNYIKVKPRNRDSE